MSGRFLSTIGGTIMQRGINVKISLVIIGIITLSFFLGNITKGHASLMEGIDPNFGVNSLTIDTDTGLAWLDLTIT
jgi:hypothetical protein